MADEGGVSGMLMETQFDEYEVYDGPVLEWSDGPGGPSPALVAASVALGAAGAVALGFAVARLAHHHRH